MAHPTDAPDLLLDAHRRDLERTSGIAPEIIARRGYRTVHTKSEIVSLGFSRNQARPPALLIPVHGVTGEIVFYQLRSNDPRIVKGKALKYETPAGARMALDIHPSVRPRLADPTVPLWITEGIKKGDSLVSQGCCTLAVVGVWNWRGTNPSGGKTALADWELVALNDRTVYVCYDSDVMTKRPVYDALERLRAFLEMRGARVGLVYLPSGPSGQKVGVDDYLASGHSIDDLLRLVSDRLRRPQSESGRPRQIVVSGRHMREISKDAVGALHQANAAEPCYFMMGNVLVEFNKGKGEAEPLSAARLKGVLDRASDFIRIDGQGNEHPSRPPNDVVTDMLSDPYLPLPPLRGVATHPVFLPDGSMVARHGYDSTSGVYVNLGEFTPFVNNWTIESAVAFIMDELFGDFPFADVGSRAHALALLVQPFVRLMIDGLTPLFLIDAPAEGTGKGLLADVIIHTSMGRIPGVMALPPNEEEIEKRITSALVAGRPVVMFDNVTTLSFNSINAALTARDWLGRLLGRSQLVRVPNQATWLATGNNVKLSNENVRRVVPIRLDAGVERPAERTGFRHPDLMAWATKNRELLVGACLTIVQHWVAAGMPGGSRMLGRYEQWSSVMGGILDVASVDGFLGNRERLYHAADRDTVEWVAFCAVWAEAYGNIPVTAKDLLDVAKSKNLLLDFWAGRSQLSAQQRIGHALARQVDRVFGPWAIRSAGTHPESRNHAYRLAPGPTQGSPKTPETPPNTRHVGGCEVSMSGSHAADDGATDSSIGLPERAGVSGVLGVSTTTQMHLGAKTRKRVNIL